MTNKTIALSRELVETIHSTLVKGGVSIGALSAALAEPVPPTHCNHGVKVTTECELCGVPPAGGDMEVLGYWCVPKDAPLQGRYLEREQISSNGFSESFTEVYHVTALTDVAQFARLQAEVERLKSMSSDPFDRMRDLQAELTKRAR